MANRADRKALLALLVLAITIRLLIVLVFFAHYKPIDDAAEWHRSAINFLDGKGLIVSNDLKAYRTPVPALYFAGFYYVFGVSPRPIQVMNILFGAVTVWFAFDLMKRSFGARSAFWAGLLISVYPLFLFYTGQMLSETPVLMLIVGGLWLAWVIRSRPPIWFATLGIVFGLATLTRETALPIAVLVAVWGFAVQQSGSWPLRVGRIAVMFCALALTLSPWTVRNYIVLGRFIPFTSQGGLSLWIANNPAADGTGVGGKVIRVPEVEALPEVDRGVAYKKLAVQFITENPVRFVNLSVRRVLYFWHVGYHGEGLKEFAFLLFYVPILVMGVIGSWRGWHKNRDATLLLLVVPFSLTVMHTVFLPVGRYRLPAELMLCMFAGLGIAEFVRRREESDRRVRAIDDEEATYSHIPACDALNRTLGETVAKDN